MEKVSAFMTKVINFLLMVFVSLLVAVTFIQVLCRFVFKIPVSWTEELVRMNFVWLIFLGAAIAVKEKSHLVMDVFTGNFKGKGKLILNVAILLMIIAIFAVLFVSGTQYCLRSVGKSAVTMPIPANCVYISAPVASLAAIFFAIERIRNEFAEYKEGEAK